MKHFDGEENLSFVEDYVNWKYQLGEKVKAPFYGEIVEGVIGVRDTVQHAKGEISFRYFVVNKAVEGKEFGFDVLEKDVTPIS
jgi:hypothetical protein